MKPHPFSGLLNLAMINLFIFGHELHNYLLYFKIFLLSNMSFQSKEMILSKERLITMNTLPTCTKEVRTFSSLVDPR